MYILEEYTEINFTYIIELFYFKNKMTKYTENSFRKWWAQILGFAPCWDKYFDFG